MNKDYYAHIRVNSEKKFEYQSVKEHSENTAKISEKILRDIGIGKVGYITGILHDMGKFKKEFQMYLLDAVNGKNVRRGSVTHTFSGTKYILDNYHPDLNDSISILTETIAIAIASHHGLIDIEKDDKDNGLEHRSTGDLEFQECLTNFEEECLSKTELNVLMIEAKKEFDKIIEQIKNAAATEIKSEEDFYKYSKEVSFYMSLVDRLVLSALVEGDRLDTASFMNGKNINEYTGINWCRISETIDKKIRSLPNNTNINAARATISNICAEAGLGLKGVYRLNIPTGGGKTLSSLRFAVHHATANKMKRIIFCTPLLSILEQNAAIIKDYVGDNSIILEHHSNVVQVENDNSSETISPEELLIENWEAPIIITTLVQLLNTLFSGKMSSIRRFHSLIDSIIVIDEVQTVPVKMLSLFNLVVNFLNKICGATVVLSSATQPSLVKTEHSIVSEIKDIVPYKEELWKVFKRTEIKDGGDITIEEIPTYIEDKLKNRKSLLVVCNKKDEAEQIYNSIVKSNTNCLHLSASMCMEHRRYVLKIMKEKLAIASIECPFICVSTQVIEAGVDVSFECVIRIMAGMDSVVQSAGRCNRNGENQDRAPVYIVNLLGENLGKLKDIKRGKDSTLSLLHDYSGNEEKYGFDLSSDEAISGYYEKYYCDMNDGAMDFCVPKHNTSIFELLSTNEKWCKSDKYFHHQAFKEAGICFEVFDSETIDVIVPYGNGQRIIEEMNSCPEWNLWRKAELVKNAKSYTVSLYSWQYKKMEEEGTLHWCMNGTIAYVTSENYDNATGLCTTRKQLKFMEV